MTRAAAAMPGPLAAALGLLLAAVPPDAARAADAAQVMQLLDQRRCEGCRLQDADLVQADLRDARLRNAQLQRANLSGSRLDGADLRGADLSFTSLAGASLRGADLRGSLLLGSDLRQADLSGASLDAGALSRSHWQQAIGIASSAHSYAELHNAGVAAARQGRYPQAEQWFGEAIRREPEAAISWVARAICRAEQGQNALAAQDFGYAATLYRRQGETREAQQLEQAATRLQEPDRTAKGNGMGSALMGGLLGAIQLLGPLAGKALLPMGL
jgi:tetratricopeptide (TPR) repeat protein